MKTLVVVLLLSGLITTTSQAQWGALVRTSTTNSADKEVPSAPGTKALKEYPSAGSDDNLRRQLQSLIDQSGWYSSVALKVKDGIVTFEGVSKSRDHLRLLVETAQRLPDTVAVVNKVEVQPPVIDNLDPLIAQLREFAIRLWQFLPALLIGLTVLGCLLFFGRYLNSGVRNAWKWRIANPFLLALVSRLTLVPIWVLIFYFTLRLMGMPNVGATILGGTGFLTLMLALAFKGIAENYLAGILLASRSPFTKGDLIQVGDYQGYVQNLNMRGTTIIDLNGNLILIPNIMVIQSVVENRTANPSMRTSFTVQIGHQDSILRAKELIIAAMADVKGVLKDPPPNVVVDSLGTFAVQLRVLIWLNVRETPEARVKSRAMIQTKETLLAHGIVIPNEARELVFTEPLKIQMMHGHEKEASDRTDRKSEIQRNAAHNLAESKRDESPAESPKETLMDLAEKNPLPVNRGSSDLLQKEDSKKPT